VIRAAQVGLGWWGKTLVESVQHVSPDIQFVAAVSRSQPDDQKQFAADQKLTLYKTYEEVLADPRVDAVVLATPHSLHSPQVIAAATAKHVFCEAVCVDESRHRRPWTRPRRPASPSAQTALPSGDDEAPAADSLGRAGTVLHIEATMTFPNGLFVKPDAWRADKPRRRAGR
jgi:hypothetical protein